MSLFGAMVYVTAGLDLSAVQKQPENHKIGIFLNSVKMIREEALDRVLDPEIDPDMLNIIWSCVITAETGREVHDFDDSSIHYLDFYRSRHLLSA